MSIIPNLYIPGAARSATTFIASTLSASPEIYSPEIKESHYMASGFIPGPLHKDDPFFEYEKYIIRDRDAYLKKFDNTNNSRFILDASPTYLFYSGTAEIVRAHCPDARIIISLRNPTERAFSQYKLNVRLGNESLDFSEALNVESERLKKGFFMATSYKTAGLYSEQVQEYIKVFGKDNIHFVLFEDIRKNTLGAIKGIFKFLNIEFRESYLREAKTHATGFPAFRRFNNLLYNRKLREFAKRIIKNNSFRNRINSSIININSKDITMDPAVRRQLDAFYKDDIERLENIIGISLAGWTDKEK